MANSKAYASFVLLFTTFLVFPHDVLTHNLPKVDDDNDDGGDYCNGLKRFPSTSTIPQQDNDDGGYYCQQIFSSIKPTKVEPKRDHHTTDAIDYQLSGLKDIIGFQRAAAHPDAQPDYYTHHLHVAKSGHQIDSTKGFQRTADAHPDAQPDHHTYHLPVAKSGRQIDSTGHHRYDIKRDDIEILNMMNYEDASGTLKKRKYENEDEDKAHYKDDNQTPKKRNYHDETRTIKKINYDDGTETLKKRNYENEILKKINFKDETEPPLNKNYEDEIAMMYRKMMKP